MICCAALLLAAQISVSDSVWTEDADNYSITMTYPSIALENDVIGNRLEEYAMAQVITFKEHFLEYFNHEVQMDWGLETNFTLEPSPEGMICLMSWTWEYAGGAHGNTWTQAFVYDSEAEAFIGPVELLGGEAEFKAFAEEAMIQLDDMLEHSSWIEEGASPTPENYHSVLPVLDESGDIEGYSVLFSPYQVAAYVYGPIEVFVPADSMDAMQ